MSAAVACFIFPRAHVSDRQRLMPWRHWAKFGSTRTDLFDLRESFHVPSEAEYAAAFQLVARTIDAPLQYLARVQQAAGRGDMTLASAETTLATLAYLRRIVKGADGILGPFTNSPTVSNFRPRRVRMVAAAAVPSPAAGSPDARTVSAAARAFEAFDQDHDVPCSSFSFNPHITRDIEIRWQWR